MPLNRPLFEQRLAALRAAPTLAPGVIDALAATITSDDDWQAFRINPLAFADAHHVEPPAALDVFLHASRVGLLDLRFNVLCPGCGAVEYQVSRMDAVPARAWHCIVCDRDVTADLDDRVEVTFTPEVGVRGLDLQQYDDVDRYWSFFFSANFVRSPELTRFVKDLTLGLFLVPPGGEASFSFEAQAGQTYRLLSLDAHAHTMLPTTSGGVSALEVSCSREGLAPVEVPVKPGPVSVRLVNRGRLPVGVMAVRIDWDGLSAVLAGAPSRMRPFLTAKMLLNSQTFRELFRVQQLDQDLQLRLRSLTLLFTDLKGSTELYDRTGDLHAWQFVREHFRVLSEAVRRHHGAIIKTMGDAIMASFNEPTDAAHAAVEMMAGMQALETRLQAEGHQTGLKVGLHEGPALAVTAEERLDYFGQTVNVAARVQALAQAGEIWATPSVMDAPGVAPVMASAGWRGELREVALKGVGGTTKVHRLAR
jgi:class 3 adenylate cyclase